MTKLSDTQLLILSAAAQRANMLVLPLPNTLKGGAAQKVISSLGKQGLIEEIDADMRIGEPVWRDTGDGHGVTLVITEAGLAALGVQNEDAPNDREATPVDPTDAPTPGMAPDATIDNAVARDALQPSPIIKARAPREGTKQAALIAMLHAPEGATIGEIVSATGWLPHTARGAIAGALKKRLGFEVISEKVDGRGRVYKIEV